MCDLESVIQTCTHLVNIGEYEKALDRIKPHIDLYSFSLPLMTLYVQILIKTGNLIRAFNVATQLQLKGENIQYSSKLVTDEVIQNYEFSSPHLKHYMTTHFKNLQQEPRIAVTMTSCKRLTLFRKTVNSFLNACEDIDLIDKWIVVDDNSSEHDREIMKTEFPFIDFYWKTPEQKGHVYSMNLLMELTNGIPYILHLEDDFLFYHKARYISHMIRVLCDNEKIGQVLFNKNYAEIPDDISIPGGIPMTTMTHPEFPYIIHEYTPTREECKKFVEKYGNAPSNSYWPHYSLRPGLMKSQVWKTLGAYKEDAFHFEREYANRYTAVNFITAFLPVVVCQHIGKLTTDKHNTVNAYTLNNVKQFNDVATCHVDDVSSYYVINLDRRPDRYEKFQTQILNLDMPVIKRFSAVDGRAIKLLPQHLYLFDVNDYNYNAGMIGCALSHILLMIQFYNQERDKEFLVVFEDDVKFSEDFRSKYINAVHEFIQRKGDMLLLGNSQKHSGLPSEKHHYIYQPKTVAECLRFSYGGSFGYVITRQGIRKLLREISRTGMVHCIDTMFQVNVGKIDLYYCTPSLVFTPMAITPEDDTDIQFNKHSLFNDDCITDERAVLEKIIGKEHLDTVTFIPDSTNVSSNHYSYKIPNYMVCIPLRSCPQEKLQELMHLRPNERIPYSNDEFHMNMPITMKRSQESLLR